MNCSGFPLWWGWQKKSGASCSRLFGSSSVCLPVVCYVAPLTVFHPQVLPRFCLVREATKPFGRQHAAVLARYFLSLFNPRSGESPGRCLPAMHRAARERALRVRLSSRRSSRRREGLRSQPWLPQHRGEVTLLGVPLLPGPGRDGRRCFPLTCACTVARWQDTAVFKSDWRDGFHASVY